MTKRTIAALAVFVAGFVISGTWFTRTVNPNPGLIQGSHPGVYYYYARDGKRYVFPDESTLNSWYPPPRGANIISDEELAGIQIGGAMRLKPGSRFVMIPQDPNDPKPRLYAVARYGVLRKVALLDLYQDGWSNATTLNEAFVANYTPGEEIADESQYNPAVELAAADIEAEVHSR